MVSAAGAAAAVSSFTMSLVQGWDRIPPEQGGRPPVVDDLILLEVRKPQVTAPPDWTTLGEFTWTDDDGDERTGHAFCKIIGPREIDPLFTTTEPEPAWEILGHALTGYAPAGGEAPGSAVPWPPTSDDL